MRDWSRISEIVSKTLAKQNFANQEIKSVKRKKSKRKHKITCKLYRDWGVEG